MSKRLKDHTEEELREELKRRGSQYMGKEARGEDEPIPVADPTRPGKQMHDPLEGDERSGLEQPEETSQESDGEVGGEEQDDTGEEVDDGDQTVEGDDGDDDGEADAGQDRDHLTSDQSKGPV